ncbi:hypothetical protein [Poriferisphaera sp. WC338]|uniref:hypothetical protein n=1 Tax=Poriferisphaera sp. WC338 TaxID=3425129 RepID=UPI003D81832F
MPSLHTTVSVEALDQDLLCTNCEYNLRTLTPAQSCPECGHSVFETLQQQHLCNAPLPYLTTLRTAVTRLLITPLFYFGFFLIMIAHNTRIIPGNIYYIQATIILTLTPIQLFYLFAIFKLTTPHPYQPKHPNLIRTIRITAILVFTLSLLQHLISFVQFMPNVSYLPYLLFPLNLLNTFCNQLHTISALFFIAAFSLGSLLNTHRRPLRLIAKIMIPFTAIILLIRTLLITFLLFLAPTTGSFPPSFLILNYITMACTFGLLICYICILIYLFRFRRALSVLINNRSDSVNKLLTS